MRHALESYAIGGVSHNISFLETIMKNDRFIKGNLTTGFIKEEFPAGFSGSELDSQAEEVLIASAMDVFLKNYERNSHMTGQLRNRNKQISERWVVMIDNKSYLVNLVNRSSDETIISCNNKKITLSSSWNNGEKLYRGKINGRDVGVKIRENNNTGSYLMQYSGLDAFVSVYSPRTAELSKFMPKIDKNAKPTKLSSPITGKIVRFKVAEGEEVKSGTELVVIEAMKMENSIRTDHDVTIKSIKFAEGEAVGIGQVIIEYA
jgi:propionyl-CoA carboxylase alpha chain